MHHRLLVCEELAFAESVAKEALTQSVSGFTE
jgi:hypothetical protein